MKYLCMVLLLCSVWTDAADRLMTEDEFTTDIAQLLKSKNSNVEITVVGSLKIETKDDSTNEQAVIVLTNRYQLYKSQTEDIETSRTKIANTFLSINDKSKNAKTQSIIPIIRSVNYIKSVAAAVKINDINPATFPIYYEKVSDDLVKVYMFDSETTTQSVSKKDITSLGIDETISNIAHDNLTKYYQKHGAKLEKVNLDKLGEMYYFIADDTYESSVMTSFDYIESQLPNSEKPWVVFLPSRNVAMIVSTEHPFAVLSVSTYAKRLFKESPYAISPNGYRKSGEEWINIGH